MMWWIGTGVGLGNIAAKDSDVRETGCGSVSGSVSGRVFAHALAQDCETRALDPSVDQFRDRWGRRLIAVRHKL